MSEIVFLEELIPIIDSLNYGTSDEVDSFIKRTELIITKIFGKESQYLKDFKQICFFPENNSNLINFLSTKTRGIREAKNLVDIMITDLRITNELNSKSNYSKDIPVEKIMKMKNNKIQLATRRNILDGFLITRILWYGELSQSSFLGRLYDLSKLPSYDSRYNTASEDIDKHTLFNFDWPDEWIFTDNRFNLLHATDKEFIDFLCLTIHPTVRKNTDEITTLIEIYSNNLKRDGFKVEKSDEIAGQLVFIITNDTTSENQNKTISIIDSTELKSALVIGCSKYENGPLINPFNDATAMDAILKKLGFNVTTMFDTNQKELKSTIDKFGEALKGCDIGLFYFAGHGIQVKGQNYLVPIDANLKSEKMVEYDCVEASRILSYMEDAKTLVNLLILDACRNNPFERSWGRGIGLRGLATMNAPKGSLIAYSTSPGTTASDGDGNNGLYTESLLNHISEKSISINTMFQKVRTEVMEKSNEQQVPWESTSLTADFYFNK